MIKTHGFRTTYSATSPGWLIPRHPQSLFHRKAHCALGVNALERSSGHRVTVALSLQTTHRLPPSQPRSGPAAPARSLRQEPAASDRPAIAIFTMRPGSGSFIRTFAPLPTLIFRKLDTSLDELPRSFPDTRQEEMQLPPPTDGRIEPLQGSRGSSKPWPHCGITATEV